MTVIDVQLTVGPGGWPELRDRVLAAEADGIGCCWLPDHLSGHSVSSEHGMYECFATLGALAVATTTIELGTLVVNVGNRTAGLAAVAAASIAGLSGRPFWFGIGAGASPSSRWAAEQHAVGSPPPADVADRHRAVVELLELTRTMWGAGRDRERFAGFSDPNPPPHTIVGVNSIGLSELAGRLADGINVKWSSPRRHEFLAAADRAAGDRPFVRTAFALWDPALLDADHPTRREMTAARVDRLVLARYG